MTEKFGIALLVFALVAMITGAWLSYRAISRYGSASAPRGISWHPRGWWRGWNSRHYFTEVKGYRLSLGGRVLMALGALAACLVFALGPRHCNR